MTDRTSWAELPTVRQRLLGALVWFAVYVPIALVCWVPIGFAYAASGLPITALGAHVSVLLAGLIGLSWSNMIEPLALRRAGLVAP